MEKEYIINNFKDICEATVDINKCLNDNDYLCKRLNSTDLYFINQLYSDKEKEGVVIDIRKEVAKSILLSELNVDKMLEVINKHKSNNPQKLKAWSNPYRILHPIINNSYLHLDSFIIEFSKILIENIGDVKYTISDFNGSQHQGSQQYWIAFYNKEYKSQSEGNQIFFNFNEGEMTYGIYNHLSKNYLIGPVKVDFDTFLVDDIYKFIDENKNTILDEKIEPGMTFADAGKFILEEFGNKPMSATEIWSEISKRNLVRTSGKTPGASLNTILSSLSVNLEKVAENRDTRKNWEIKNSIFEIVSTNPYKYRLSNYMPKHIKENLTNNGFITKEMLIEILSKNNINIEI
jgi:hypothetical protein